MKQFKYLKNGELDDVQILRDLLVAHDIYETGAIIETRDVLNEIVRSIDEFDRQWEKGGI